METAQTTRGALDMTRGSPIGLIVRFSLPMMLGGAFQLLYNTVDTIVLGKYVGADALAAMGTASSAYMLVFGFSFGLMNGVTVLMARYFGAGERVKLKQSCFNAALLCAMLGLFLGTLSLLSAHPLMRLLGATDAVLDGASEYLRIVCGLAIVQVFYGGASAVLNALGDSRTPLVFLILCSLLNVALDLLLVVKCGLGIAGAAYATVLSQLVSVLLCVLYIVRRYPMLCFGRDEAKWSGEIQRGFLNIGLPLGLKEVLCSAGMLVIAAVINSFGKEVMAGYTIGSKVENICIITYAQFTFAFSVYASQNYGARQYDRILSGMRRTLLLVGGTCVASTLLVILLRMPLIGLFVDTGEAAVVMAASSMIVIEAIFYLPLGYILLFLSAMEGVGRGRVILLSAVIELVSKIVFSILLAHLFGYVGIWFAAPIGWILGLIPPCVCFYRKRWLRDAIASANTAPKALP